MAFLQRAAAMMCGRRAVSAMPLSLRAFSAAAAAEKTPTSIPAMTLPPKSLDEKITGMIRDGDLYAEGHGSVRFPHKAMADIFSKWIADSEQTDLEAARRLPDGWWNEEKHQQQMPDGWQLDPRFWAAREAEIEKRCSLHNLSPQTKLVLQRELAAFQEDVLKTTPAADRFVDFSLTKEAAELVETLHGYVPAKMTGNRFTDLFIVSTPEGKELVWRGERCEDNDDATIVLEIDGFEVVYPTLHQTLDWVLPTPVPVHSFNELPVIKEVPYTSEVSP